MSRMPTWSIVWAIACATGGCLFGAAVARLLTPHPGSSLQYTAAIELPMIPGGFVGAVLFLLVGGAMGLAYQRMQPAIEGGFAGIAVAIGFSAVGRAMLGATLSLIIVAFDTESSWLPSSTSWQRRPSSAESSAELWGR